MRKKKIAGLLLIPVVTLVIIAAERGRHFKEPAVAGTFYPAARGELKQTVDRLLAGVSRIVAMSFCEPRSCRLQLSS